ncbi:hypothetical protein [Clostridium sp.]|uniref:hypothetical protein n=1 Tax=Clostridium sp. TaxID=1506 RepID=UPI00262451B9|nr:hypothetical protein [Clostridium sp.]
MLDNFLINTMLYKRKKKSNWSKYFLLEKLLSANENSVSNNTGDFTCDDAAELIRIYNINNLYTAYSSECFYNNEEPNRANYNKMIHPLNKSRRNPNIRLIKTLIDVILIGTLSKDNGSYFSIDPLEKFEALSNEERFDLCSYIRFCKIVSAICNIALKEWDIEKGNELIRKNALEMRKKLIPILRNTSLIFEYCININSLNENIAFEDDAQKSAIEDLYAPLPWELPQHSLQDYNNFIEKSSDTSYIEQLLLQLPDSVLLWIKAYSRDLLFNQEKFFLQLLFLLLFVSKDDLNKYVHFIPDYTLSIPKIHANNYYKNVQKLYQLPSIDFFYCFSNQQDRIDTVTYITTSLIPDISTWLKFLICNITDVQLEAAKNLYFMIFIRHKFRLKQEDSSFPADALSLLAKANPEIDDIYRICKRSPFL